MQIQLAQADNLETVQQQLPHQSQQKPNAQQQQQQLQQQHDWFGSLDSNQDGSLDRKEFDQGLLKLESVLHLPLSQVQTQAQAQAQALTQPSYSSKLSQYMSSLSHGTSFWKGFSSGVAMIFATEIGDKTFFIAAVLSMRHSRSAVFAGAITALILMTILSTAMGLVLPQFMDRRYTHFLGGILFLYFGLKLLYESKQMEANRVSEELEEVEEELLKRKKDDKELSLDDKRHHRHEDVDDDEIDEERGKDFHRKLSVPTSASSVKQQSSLSRPNSMPTTFHSASSKKPTWFQIALQSLTLTFLAEWGDRSQIATIALAAAKNPYGVTLGGCLGHSCCTGLAVLGGRMLAARISEKSVSFWGGMIFLVFGLHSIFLES